MIGIWSEHSVLLAEQQAAILVWLSKISIFKIDEHSLDVYIGRDDFFVVF